MDPALEELIRKLQERNQNMGQMAPGAVAAGGPPPGPPPPMPPIAGPEGLAQAGIDQGQFMMPDTPVGAAQQSLIETRPAGEALEAGTDPGYSGIIKALLKAKLGY